VTLTESTTGNSSTLSTLSRTLQDLEFGKIVDELIRYTVSHEGKEKLRNLFFFSKPDQLEREHTYVDEIVNVWAKQNTIWTGVFPGITGPLKSAAAEGGMMEGEEIFEVFLYINSAVNLLEFYSTCDGYSPMLIMELLAGLPDLRQLASEISHALESPGTVKETHPRIKPLIQEFEQARRDRGSAVDVYFKRLPDTMQQDRAVMRDGRIVLPVKSADKNQIQGIVHGSSSTGATLFMEPIDLIEKNNRVAVSEQKIAIEIRAILRELTAAVRKNLPEIAGMQSIVGTLDAYAAKARYGEVHNCHKASYCPKGIHLKKARHPLLYSHAVPIDIEIDEDTHAMIMSGPNAGGKTVTLKTIGLLSLMNQFGLFIPAGEGSSLPLFDLILTDIGDEQSIEASLSTFSGHMKNISEILQTASEHTRSLVILDELGSGTDPVEGSALARAVLEYASQRAALTLITSHHSVLKQYAYASKGIINASMEFDDTLKTPTFRVISGMPGESHAIETAVRMKMPEAVIEKARTYLSGEFVQISAIIKGLEERRKEQDEILSELRQKQKVIRDKSREYDLKILKIRQEEAFKRQTELSQLTSFGEEARKKLENLVRELKEGEVTREKTKRVKEYIRELDLSIKNKEQELSAVQNDIGLNTVLPLKEGMRVRLSPSGKIGTIIKKDREGYWTVLIDSIKITFPERDITGVSDTADDHKNTRRGKREPTYFSGADIAMNSRRPLLTLDVRGKTLQEALSELEIQLDSAVMHNLTQFSVIHGKGDGVLQEGIHTFLRETRSVTSFSFAPPEDGGYGKTYVILYG
jgi:DNA mismatch repair protein MutS2